MGKFELGHIIMTKGITEREANNEGFANFLTDSMKRHSNGDWGDLSEEDKQENELSLKQGLRVLSKYHYGEEKILIVTDVDKSMTTILFPEEY